MRRLFIFFIIILLTDCQSHPSPARHDESTGEEDSVMICCPDAKGFSCDWITASEDGEHLYSLASARKKTGVMMAVCPLK